MEIVLALMIIVTLLQGHDIFFTTTTGSTYFGAMATLVDMSSSC